MPINSQRHSFIGLGLHVLFVLVFSFQNLGSCVTYTDLHKARERHENYESQYPYRASHASSGQTRAKPYVQVQATYGREASISFFLGGGSPRARVNSIPIQKERKKKLRKNESATLRKISCVLGKKKISFFCLNKKNKK